MANNILKYKGHPIGKSIQEKNCEEIISDIFKLSKNHSCSVIYPNDVVVGKTMEDNPKIKELNEVNNDELILDIGPRTIERISNI